MARVRGDGPFCTPEIAAEEGELDDFCRECLSAKSIFILGKTCKTKGCETSGPNAKCLIYVLRQECREGVSNSYAHHSSASV